ncbi:hypothetical protein FH972_024314 [Carpinus fangiana]|uniref:Heme oxygenase-like protein n=1 Tax=Carpinus fangiana TaxID=176857 RepID=A0A5N6L072_9ROSI|nr:hypothetical protein FH972_024314 [Carpinus fangiana]
MSPDSHRTSPRSREADAASTRPEPDSTAAWSVDAGDSTLSESISHDLAGMEQAILSTTSKPTSSLSDEINAACRSLHADLNSAIVQATPHGLPPEAQTPALYAHGLAVFVGTVYQTYEAEWNHLRRRQLATVNDADDVDEEKNHRKKLHRYLAHVLPAGIERTPRIRRDLAYLGVDPARRPNPNTVEARYEQHIQTHTRQKPHLLLAYAWCMYMAIFAGGRYVRQGLSDVPKSFWEGGKAASDNPFFEDDEDDDVGSSSTLDRLGYSFLSFDGDDDGASIVSAFRKNFAGADKILTAGERDEIIAESRTIFEYCVALVDELNDGVSALVENVTITYEDAERVVDQEKRMLMQALEMGDEEGRIARPPRARTSRMFLVKAVVFGLIWTLLFGKIVTWLTNKTPENNE